MDCVIDLMVKWQALPHLTKKRLFSQSMRGGSFLGMNHSYPTSFNFAFMPLMDLSRLIVGIPNFSRASSKNG